MRNYLFLIVFCLIVTAASAVNAGASPRDAGASESVGRYQLFQGTYTSFDLKRQQSSTATSIFLLDTKTGEVKRYINKIDEDGKYIETWYSTELQEKK